DPQVPLAGLLVALHRRATRKWSTGPDGEPLDPLLVGGASPALERYRTAKAAEAERRNREAEGELIRVEEVGRDLEAVGRMLRVEVEALATRRPDAAGLFDEVLKRAEAEFWAWSERHAGGGNGKGPTGTDAATSPSSADAGDGESAPDADDAG
ncbi:MAG TPA: hypothetical protein VK661_04040, partial [Planctomycetota bacterium]|nr:hypothetical protein [Planctomycetota bacterium]